jgi:arginase family enzyme
MVALIKLFQDAEKIVDELRLIKDISVLEIIESEKNKLNELLINYENRNIFLGEGHLDSYFVGKFFFNNFRDCKLVVFDAHAGCLDSSLDDGSWLRKLIVESGQSRNIVLIGLRNFSVVEKSFLDKNLVKYYEMSRVEDVEVLCDFVTESCLGKDFCVLLDVDVIDPAFSPASKNLEVAGFYSREIIYFIKRLSLLKTMKFFSVAGIDFEKADFSVSCKLSAKIVSEVLRAT